MITRYNNYLLILENINSIKELFKISILDVLEAVDIKRIELSIEIKNDTLEELKNDKNFKDKLKYKNLTYYSDIVYLKDIESFVDNTGGIKFLLLYNSNQNELSNPEYLILEISKKLSVYKIVDDFKKFYDKISNKTISIKSNNNEYVYITSNGGLEWNNKNIQTQDDVIFKNVLTANEMYNLINRSKYEIVS